MNIVRASSVLAVSLLIVDYFLVAPNVFGQYFFGKITIALYWILQIVLLSGSRMAYRYFRYTRTRHHARSPESNPTLVLGRAADAEVLLRGIESGAITNIWPAGILSSSPADRGQSIRGIPVRGNFEMLDNVVNDLAQRGTTVTRRDLHAVGARSRGQAGSDLDARAPARAHRQPAAVARRRRRSCRGWRRSMSKTCCCGRR